MGKPHMCIYLRKFHVNSILFVKNDKEKRTTYKVRYTKYISTRLTRFSGFKLNQSCVKLNLTGN